MTKGKRDYIFIAVAIVLVAAYIFYQCYSVTHIELETQTALESVVYDKIDLNALVVRDEQVISDASGAVTVPCCSDGAKINAGGNVATVFSNSEKAGSYSKYMEIQQELSYYENLESQSIGLATDVESINDEIDGNINDYIRSMENAQYDSVHANASEINAKLLRRQLIVGENVNLLSVIQDLRAQSQNYASASKPDRYITTKDSGIFSSYTDSYENIVDYKKVTALSVDDVKTALNTVSQKSGGDNNHYFGKIVKNYNWYFVSVVDSNALKTVKKAGRVKVALKNDGEKVLTADVVDTQEAEDKNGEAVLLLRCNSMDAELAAMRNADIEIRIKEYRGIKVPNTAIHISNEEKGVYALISSQVKFRKARVLYSNEEYSVLSYDDGIEDEEERKAKEDENIPDIEDEIALYDKIITQGKDLEDGKVYV